MRKQHAEKHSRFNSILGCFKFVINDCIYQFALNQNADVIYFVHSNIIGYCPEMCAWRRIGRNNVLGIQFGFDVQNIVLPMQIQQSRFQGNIYVGFK